MVEIEETRILLNKIEANESGLLIVAGIPAFNEEKTIARVVLEAQKHAHIVVVCDDGSSDLTGEIAEHLGAIVVRHEKNSGYGAALQSLFKRARELKADVLITIDSDGQHDPAQIPELIKPIEEGVAEVVLGSRFMDKNGTADMPKYRQLGVKVITIMANGSCKNGVSDAQSGFRAYSKLALEHLIITENGMSASIELLLAIHKADLKICEVPISCRYSNNGGVKTSTENPFRHGIVLIMSLVKLVVEDRPLLFLGLPGVISIVLGLVFGVWLLDIFAQTGQIITNIALACLTFILFGSFMISTSITLYAIRKIGQKIIRN